MKEKLFDKTSAPVTVALDTAGPISFYTVSPSGEGPVGRAQFIDSPKPGVAERIFFHTEVDADYGGRGLGGLLVREALADSMRSHVTVVPVCPLFARHLQEHGDEYTAAGGKFRPPRHADIALVQHALRGPDVFASTDDKFTDDNVSPP